MNLLINSNDIADTGTCTYCHGGDGIRHLYLLLPFSPRLVVVGVEKAKTKVKRNAAGQSVIVHTKHHPSSINLPCRVVFVHNCCCLVDCCTDCFSSYQYVVVRFSVLFLFVSRLISYPLIISEAICAPHVQTGRHILPFSQPPWAPAAPKYFYSSCWKSSNSSSYILAYKDLWRIIPHHAQLVSYPTMIFG